MFNFVIATTKSTPELDKTIKVLLETKTDNDNIIIVNYNNYHIKYRGTKGVDYRHVKQGRRAAINSCLPKNSNIVILSNNITVTHTFVKDLYKHFDYRALSTFRVDNVTKDGKFIETDHRIGSIITSRLFEYDAMSFNTSVVPGIGETPEETAVLASNNSVPLKIVPNIRVLNSITKVRKTSGIGITILIPSLNFKFSDHIKDLMTDKDKLFEFKLDSRTLTRFINQKILESPNNCILIVNPASKLFNASMISTIRSQFKGDNCFIFDTSKELSRNAWMAIPKTKYVHSHKPMADILMLQKNILGYMGSKHFLESKTIRYNEPITKDSSINDSISIIIPFMYNGDRWPLFEASMKRLYTCTQKHSNIEIVVHETAPQRYLSPKFIKEYSLSYLFSEYHGLFHRAWNLNVVAKHLAKGSLLVFFDADIIIDDRWVSNLLNCDKNRVHFGYGEVTDLTEASTQRYLSKGIIKKPFLRTRVASAHANGGSINVIPRHIFHAIGGWPESYKDKGYGGEDNSLLFKMMALGYHDEVRTW